VEAEIALEAKGSVEAEIALEAKGSVEVLVMPGLGVRLCSFLPHFFS
jgi:hypothetical protein